MLDQLKIILMSQILAPFAFLELPPIFDKIKVTDIKTIESSIIYGVRVSKYKIYFS